MNMKQWADALVAAPAKKAMPVLSFPSAELLGVSVLELISSAAKQSEGMAAVAGRCDTAAAVSFMDLSVEAECFGSTVRFADNEVPTVIGGIVTTPDEADVLAVPAVGSKRSGICVEAIRRATGLITDRPVLAGVIGPFSLAGRLMDVTQAMLMCYDEPELVHTVLGKVTRFLTAYIAAYKDAGANGVVIAEPLAGVMSPDLAREFSADYVTRIVAASKTDDFAVIYHNCGGATIQQVDSILATGASGFHFGNAIRMADMLPLMPPDVPVFGNIDPAGQFRNGTPQSIRETTLALLEECSAHRNFVISSGCDVPPGTPWENIDAYFSAINDHYR